MVILFTPENIERVKLAFPKNILFQSMVILKALHDEDWDLAREAIEDKAMMHLTKYKMLEQDDESILGWVLTDLGKTTVELFNAELANTLVVENLGTVDEEETIEEKKTKKINMVNDVDNWIDQWQDLWPSNKETGGAFKNARETVVDRMKKWVAKFGKKYSKEVIMEATALYIREQRFKNWAFTRKDFYFISKKEPGGEISDLATYCQTVLEQKGGQSEDPFKNIAN